MRCAFIASGVVPDESLCYVRGSSLVEFVILERIEDVEEMHPSKIEKAVQK